MHACKNTHTWARAQSHISSRVCTQNIIFPLDLHTCIPLSRPLSPSFQNSSSVYNTKSTITKIKTKGHRTQPRILQEGESRAPSLCLAPKSAVLVNVSKPVWTSPQVDQQVDEQVDEQVDQQVDQTPLASPPLASRTLGVCSLPPDWLMRSEPAPGCS